MHLPGPCTSGLQLQTKAVVSSDMAVLFENQRARANECHVALQNVEQLGKLIERVPPQNAPNSRDTRIIGDLEHASVPTRSQVHVQMREFALPFLGVDRHGAKLPDSEDSFRAHSHLSEEDRSAWVIDLDQDRDDQTERDNDDETRKRERDIEYTLEEGRRTS